MAGLSMCGFSGAGFIAPGSDITRKRLGVWADVASFWKKKRLVCVSIGTAEQERKHIGVNNLDLELEKTGIKYVDYASFGISHEWLTWHRCLHQIAPLFLKRQFSLCGVEYDVVSVINRKPVQLATPMQRSLSLREVDLDVHRGNFLFQSEYPGGWSWPIGDTISSV